MDELGLELQGALERAEEEGRRNRVFGELAARSTSTRCCPGRWRPPARSKAPTRRS
jgi:hypothetical protein